MNPEKGLVAASGVEELAGGGGGDQQSDTDVLEGDETGGKPKIDTHELERCSCNRHVCIVAVAGIIP